MSDRILLFDLGGVLIRLRIEESLKAISSLSLNWEEIKTILLGNPNVRKFECGQCSSEEYAASFISDLQLDMSIDEFLEELATWPVGFYDGAKELLADLRRNYSVNCFSNTNEIHWKEDWAAQFDQAFASHLIGSAKPDPAAFRHVIEALDTPVAQIYFFDDTKANVVAAEKLGINAFHTDGFEPLHKGLIDLSFVNPEVKSA